MILPMPGVLDRTARDRLTDLCLRQGIDILIVSCPRNLYYTLGYSPFDSVIESGVRALAIVPCDGRESVLIMPRADAGVLADFPVTADLLSFYGSFYLEGEHRFSAPEVLCSARTMEEAFAKSFQHVKVAGGNVGIEFDTFPYRLQSVLGEAIGGATIVDAGPPLRRARAIKSDAEIARLRASVSATSEVLDAVPEWLRVGLTERQVASRVAQELLERDLEPIYVLVGSGSRSGFGNFPPSDRVIGAGENVLIDASGRYGGYHSDLGRSYVIGAIADDEFGKMYGAVRFGLEEAIAMVRPGVAASAVFEAAVNGVRAAGIPGFRRHHVGHGIGLQAHEWPSLRADSTDELELGMVLAVEVPYYIGGSVGFTPEDIVLVTETGCERLSHCPESVPHV